MRASAAAGIRHGIFMAYCNALGNFVINGGGTDKREREREEGLENGERESKP